MVAGRYSLVRQLGQGGMGVVWQARDELLHRDVAIKEIYLPSSGGNPADSADPLTRRALREAQAAAQLRHPAIITVHDVVTDDGRPWIVMELIGGRSLAEVIGAQGVLATWQAAEIGLRVLEALQAAHRQGVLHRDVKPANILLDDQRVVLTDFGIAAIDGATVLTRTGQMVGSPSYLSPERINGRPATPAADLWGLGVTLYAMVTGRSPFQREDTQATLAAVLTSQPGTPAHAGQLWPVIKGLLVKDVDRRLTADQAAPLLANAAQPPATIEPSRQRRKRKRQFAPETVAGTAVAPPHTIAAPTALQPVQGKPPGAKQPATAAATVGSEAATAESEADPVGRPPTTVVHQDRAGRAPASPTTVASDAVTAGTIAVDTVTTDAVAVDRVSGPPAAQSTGRAATGRRMIAAAAAVAGIVVLTVTVTHLITRPDEGVAARPTASVAAAGSPPVSVSPSPSFPPGVDPCLVGTWRITENQVWGLIDSTRVLYRGGADVLITYRADGTSFTDYNKMKPRVTRYRGATWSDVVRGTISGRYHAEDGAITSTRTKSSAVDTLRRNGKVDVKGPLAFFPEPSQYRCTGDDLYLYSAQGNFSNQLVRVSGQPS
ncbi:hypothetical protein Ari01nite_03870 [Paractinoplanes rishiriensis]|uniref:non-specific serine/threonine protein kinase n=2 Tax=Paractinoplanes rishiriensis TaxID=1050105 RepID=A0A919JT67_9ACTN|nr:hypothetical protein Ari01nite_03870 [Actinoplanes rishiriensis]